MKETCLLHRQKCADPEIFESASVRRFWPKIHCQSASATREKYWIRVRLRPHWIGLLLVINTWGRPLRA